MDKHNRRDFLKRAAIAGSSVIAVPSIIGCNKGSNNSMNTAPDESIESSLIVPSKNGIQITGTFIDEISHDHIRTGAKENGISISAI